MATELKRRHEIELIIEDIGGGNGRNRPPTRRGGGGGDWRGRKDPEKSSRQRSVSMVVILLGSVAVFFLAALVAYVWLKYSNPLWQRFRFPSLASDNTAVLLASSATMELARWRLKKSDVDGFRGWWAVTSLLGMGFVAGQIAV